MASIHVLLLFIRAGDKTAVPAEINTDRDGHERFFDDPDMPDTGKPVGFPPFVDMGAYEMIVFTLDDLASFADCMSGPGSAQSRNSSGDSQTCLDAYDFDNDGDVDLEDSGTAQRATRRLE